MKTNEQFWKYKRSLTAEQVLDEELIIAHLGTLDSFETPYDALNELLTYHIDLAMESKECELRKQTLDEKMYKFIHYIATDYFELSQEKVRIQRDDYVRMAQELMKELNQ